MRKIALWGAAALAAVGLAAGTGTGASAAVRLAPKGDQLVGVSCASTTSCVAVGANFTSLTPLAETWGPAGWSPAKAKLPAGFGKGELDGVSCPAAKDCVAVGNYLTKAGTPFALGEFWNGKAWTPAKASGSPGTVLISVSCASAKYCLAVGSYETPAGTGHPIADTWNGAKWAQVQVPAPAHEAISLFDSVSCVSASFCMATGEAATATGPTTALTGEWNGKKWAYLKSAAAKGLTDVDLEGVSCPTAKSCVTVGNGALAKGGTASLVEAWNGKSWARTSAIAWPKGSKNPWLVGMSCYAAGHCLTAGFIDWNPNAGNGQTTGRAAAASWNGKSWASTPVPAPAVGKATSFDAVSCKSVKFCVAVGLAGPFGAPEGDGSSLSGFWNGKTWKLVGAI